MKGQYDPDKHHRRSIRLKGYDYAQEGAYFVTICTQNRACMLGKIADGEVRLSNCGRVVRDCWNDIPVHFPHVELDMFVVMPNHMHGIVVVVDDDRKEGQGTACRAPTTTAQRFGKPVAGSLPVIVGTFKSAVTRQVNKMRKTPGASLWQRNYHEHVIRNEDELNRIRQYILNNPVRWELDAENPARKPDAPADVW